MQLDQTRIPIRERSYLELLDLALHVIRKHAAAIVFFTALGSFPCYVFNMWFLSDLAPQDISSAGDFTDDVISYLAGMAMLIVWQMPLASAFTTRYLGLAMFEDRPSLSLVVGDVIKSLPQLILVQVILRGLMTVLCVTWFVLFWFWPYLNEIILLERNNLFKGRGSGVSTFGRCTSLHAYNTGELLSRWLISLCVGVPWIVLMFVAFLVVRSGIWGDFEFNSRMVVVYLPWVIWTVVGYFGVVRFLGYLDLRIRREGWEVELRMRAEGNRLRQEMELG